MVSLSPHTRLSKPAPWRNLLSTHLATLTPPVITFTTISATTPPAPRARSVVFRGFFASLQPNPLNPAPLNPAIYTSDALTITTDIRMEKAAELQSDTGHGGLYEAVVWAPQKNAQWRLRGTAYIIPPDVDSDSPAAQRIRPVLYSTLRNSTTDEPVSSVDPTWTIKREVTAHFGNLSPGMRGSFRNPPPGKLKTETPGEGLGLGQTVDDLEDTVARENFRVVVLVVDTVDYVDLGEKIAKRIVWQRQNDGVWKEDEMWP